MKNISKRGDGLALGTPRLAFRLQELLLPFEGLWGRRGHRKLHNPSFLSKPLLTMAHICSFLPLDTHNQNGHYTMLQPEKLPGWRASSVLRKPHHYCGGLTPGGSQLPTPAPGDLMTFSCLLRVLNECAQTCAYTEEKI